MSIELDDFELDPDSSFGAPFAKLMPAELLDKRLTYGARLLIAWIRFRVGWNKPEAKVNEYTNVKVSTIVADFGCDPKTVSSWLKELEAVGILRRESAGFGRSQRKILLDPVKIYGKRRIHDVYYFLRTENRTEEVVNYFNNSTVSPKNGDTDTEPPKNGVSSSPKNGVSSSPKNGLAEEETIEAVTIESETNEEPLRGYSALKETIEEVPTYSSLKNKKTNIENTDSSYSEIKPPRDEDDSQRVASVRDSFEKSKERIAENIRRKQQALRDGSHGYEAAQRKLARDEAKAERQKNRPASAKTAEAWWRELHKSYHPGITHTRWGTREMKWAADMITEYGPDKVRKAFDYVFDNWERYRRDYSWQRLGLVPGIDFLYRERRNIMAEVETLLQHETPGDSGDSGTFF